MGTTDSKQKLGERVIAARKKLSDDIKIQSERVKEIQKQSPQTINVIMKSVSESFKSYSPFLEPTLLIAWYSNPEQCRQIILDSCKKVLNAPINKDEYAWFLKYVFPSSIWMFKTSKNRFMFEELIVIANSMQQNIIDSMNSIFNHLQSHPQWKNLENIKNQTIVSRQDHKKVGLLQDIKTVSEMKDVDDNKSDDVQAFIDSNLGVNILTATAKNMNQEFQNYINTVMSHFGDFKAGPLKKVDRCVSKLENDYQKAAYPKAAKLLDLVRCSITFNTVDQLVAGYNGLMSHIESHSGSIELARVKNGFLDAEYLGGYRDIKVNVIYHSSINPEMSMICEVQLLLGQYLHEKKRIHKLYSIVRQELYFKMTVSENDSKQSTSEPKDMSALKFKKVLNVKEEVPDANIYGNNQMGKCSMDSNLGLLAVQSEGKLSCIDVMEKKEIFKATLTTRNLEMFSHSWVTIDGYKHLAVQTKRNEIKFFKVQQDDNSFTEAKELRILLDEKDTINCCDFDKDFANIIIVKNNDELEKRAVKKSDKVLISIKLEKAISPTNLKLLSLSNDGNWCAIGSGNGNRYFYLIELDNKVQHKVTSKNLNATYAPCFINGEPVFCVVGDSFGKIEVWNVRTRVAVKLLRLKTMTYVLASASRNNILAIGAYDNSLSLWDTMKWEMIRSKKYKMKPRTIHLTNDSKYLTVGGNYGDHCLVWELK